jgi:hypothetical protein
MSSCGRPANAATGIVARDTRSAKTNADRQTRIGAYPILHLVATIFLSGLPRMPTRAGTRISLYQERPGDTRSALDGATGTAISDSDNETETGAIAISDSDSAFPTPDTQGPPPRPRLRAAPAAESADYADFADFEWDQIMRGHGGGTWGTSITIRFHPCHLFCNNP